MDLLQNNSMPYSVILQRVHTGKKKKKIDGMLCFNAGLRGQRVENIIIITMVPILLSD